jgi:hypothetical protein
MCIPNHCTYRELTHTHTSPLSLRGGPTVVAAVSYLSNLLLAWFRIIVIYYLNRTRDVTLSHTQCDHVPWLMPRGTSRRAQWVDTHTACTFQTTAATVSCVCACASSKMVRAISLVLADS